MRTTENLAYALSTLPIKTYEAALKFLGIKKEKLENIPTAAQKQKYLRYKYLLSELQFSVYCRKNNLSEEFVLNAIDGAWQLIPFDNLKDSEEYSKHSIGLQDLDLRSLYKKSQQKNVMQELEASIFVVAPKNAGAEPGFEAGQVEDTVFHLEKIFPSRKQRLNYFNGHDGNFETIYHLHFAEVPKYLFKQDYHLSLSGKVVPREEDLKRTNSVQQAFNYNQLYGKAYVAIYTLFKTGSPLEKNCDAVLEVLTNDIARASGMKVQEQTIYKSKYDDEAKTLKLMLKGKWLTNARTLAPIAGSSETKAYNNYCVFPILGGHDEVAFLSNDSIPDFSQHYGTFLLFDDYDSIGSKAQNKLAVERSEQTPHLLKVLNELVGIDFGHALRNENKLINKLLLNLHLPTASLKKYKNFSVFFDSKRSDLMQGFLIHAKLAGIKIPEELIEQYGPDFKQKISNIEPGSVEKIFADYIKKFSFLSQSEKQFANDYQTIIKKIEKTKSNFIQAREALLNKVKDKLFLPPELHDLLENLEKVSLGASKTTLRSSDGKVLLNHIRCQNNEDIIPWKAIFSNNSCKLFAIFQSEYQAKIALNELKKFTNRKIILNNNQIEIVCGKKEISEMAEELSEVKIKEIFHKKDFVLYERFCKEKNMQQLCEFLSKTITGYQFSLVLKKQDPINPVYEINVVKNKNYLFNENEMSLLNGFFKENKLEKNCLSMSFALEQIDKIYMFVKELPSYYTLLKKYEEKINQLNQYYSLKINIKINPSNLSAFLINVENIIEDNPEKSFYNLEKSIEEVETKLKIFSVIKEKIQERLNSINQKYSKKISINIDWEKNCYQLNNVKNILEENSGSLSRLENDLIIIEEKLKYQEIFLQEKMSKAKELNNIYGLNIVLTIDWEKNSFCLFSTTCITISKLDNLSLLDNHLVHIEKIMEERRIAIEKFQKDINEFNKKFDLNFNLMIDWENGKFYLEDNGLKIKEEGDLVAWKEKLIEIEKSFEKLLKETVNQLANALERPKNESNNRFFAFFSDNLIKNANLYLNRSPTAIWLKEVVLNAWLKDESAFDFIAISNLKNILQSRLDHIAEKILSQQKSQEEYPNYNEEKILLERAIKLVKILQKIYEYKLIEFNEINDEISTQNLANN